MFKNLTIGKKLACGFGVVILALMMVVGFSYTGVRGIVGNATQVIYGTELDGIMAQKEIDHLNWTGKVNSLLNDANVTTLDVQTDDHKCGFGSWLYSDARKEAERKIPGLATILKSIEEPHQHLHESAVRIGDVFVQADPALPGVIAARQVDHLNWASTIRDTFLENRQSLEVQTDPTKCALGKWLNSAQAQKACKDGSDEFKQTWAKMVETHGKLHESAKDIEGKYTQIHEGLEHLLLSRLLDHKNWVEKVSTAVIEGRSDLGVATDHSKCAYGRFLASEECAAYMKDFPALQKAVEESKKPHQHLHESAITISSVLAKGAEGKAEAEKIFKGQTLVAMEKIGECFNSAISAEQALDERQAAAKKVFDDVTTPLLHETLTHLDNLKSAAEKAVAGMNRARSIYATVSTPSLAKVQSLLHEARKTVEDNVMTQEAMLGAARGTKRNVGAIGVVGIVVGVLLAIWIARGIIVVLTRIINALTENAEQVASASGQVSSASQSLAEGATEQAAGLEETSSSLEEMSSMTKQNADNAQQANTLANEARKAAGTGAESMTRMNEAIQDIQKSSDETAKIIKVIDEIAFQTNLLALNAAVEAARAGEAGKGFAVVAEEVRNLAMRSAEAAKNTSAMIEESVRNAKNGVDIAAEVQKVLDDIVTSIGKTTDLVSEIAAASQEQAQGIDQVNTAVAQMDKVTQQNAANAEESASASEELSAQAEQMNSAVNDLVAMVGGNAADGRFLGLRKRLSGGKTIESTLRRSDTPFHLIAGTKNCWEVKQCGRVPGGSKVADMGVCPAYPNDGTNCWNVAGTFCGGKVQGSAAQKRGGCLNCEFYKAEKGRHTVSSASHVIPFDDDFGDFNS